MATFQTYQDVGMKENISDIITNLSPTKVPFQSNIGTEKVHQPLYQWQEDSLRSVAVNAQVQGADPSYITVTPTVMRQNYTQILTEAVVVADTTQAVTAYGRAKEMAYQLNKSSLQLKRDLENALVGTAQSSSAGSSSAASQFAGYQQMVAAANITYCGASTNLTEAFLLTNLQACFTSGAEPTRVQVLPATSVIVAGFAAAAGRYRTIPGESVGSSSGIVNVVNFYVSPFGEVKIEINRFLKTKNTLVYDPKQWSKMVLRPWTREALAKTGDATKQMIVTEQGLKHKNFAASGVIVDNATTGF